MKYILATLGMICFVQCIAQVIPMQPNVPQGGRAVAIARHPANNDQFMLASETGGLFKSTTRGRNWTQVSGATTFSYTHVANHRASFYHWQPYNFINSAHFKRYASRSVHLQCVNP